MNYTFQLEEVVENVDPAKVLDTGDVIEEPQFQQEVNHVDDDQIGEPPQPKPNGLKFIGIFFVIF